MHAEHTVKMKEALHLKTACPVQGGKTAALVGRQSSGTVQFLITALQAPRRSFLALLGLTGRTIAGETAL